MQIEQIYTGCLAQGAYYIEDNGEAVVIDPLREVEAYLTRAEKDGAKIKYILETHFHADFVSGHLDLADKTGATIVFGPTAQPDFSAHIAKDNEILTVGKLSIEVIHTPGHTLESSCYLLKDENGKEIAIFTGDTLFIGDVGRPDLAQKLDNDLTQEKLAGMLYDSLHQKILGLPDDLIVYPAHGAGSACGKNMSKETSDTLKHQKEVNYGLNIAMSKEEFITELTTGLMPPPAYFPENVLLNKNGYDSIYEVRERGSQPLSPDEFENLANETGALILDTRDPQTFSKGFIPNAINIGINGGFAPWVGTLIKDIKQPILIVAEPEIESEVITRLARVGYDNAIGFLAGGFDSWKEANKEIDTIESISPETFATKYAEGNISILDVRKPGEYDSSHIEEAILAPLDFVNESMNVIEKDKTYYVHCAGGYRSMIFASIMKARGFDNLIDVAGGFGKIKNLEGFRIKDNSCKTS